MTTKEKMLKSANELFITKGFANVSVKEITDFVGAGKTTFYHHFKSKEDLVEIYLDNVVSEFSSQIRIELEKEGTSRIKKINKLLELLISSKGHKNDDVDKLAKLEIYYSVSNYIYLDTTERFALKYYTPIFVDVIKEGMFFDNSHDLKKIARMIIRLAFCFSKENIELLKQSEDLQAIKKDIDTNAKEFRNMLERILSLDKNSLNYIDVSNYLRCIRT